MSLLKQYSILFDAVKKTMDGKLQEDDFNAAYNAYINISIFAGKYGLECSAIKKLIEKNERDIKSARALYDAEKNDNNQKQIEALEYLKQILTNATKGDLLVSGLSYVLVEAATNNDNMNHDIRIDVWAYECEGY